MNIAVITGASSGIGREFALQISKKFRNIDEIWVLARSIDKLNALKAEIENVTVRPIRCDVTNDPDVKEFENLLSSHKPFVRLLVNAAGFGMIGRFDELPMAENVDMCELNCTALTRITHMVLPYMKGRQANIINIASAAGFTPQPSFAVYAATKSYVLSFSTALNRELKEHNITVTAVCPGPVDTAFFDKAEKYNQVKLYKKMFRAKAPKVVELALTDAYHKRYISVYGVSMKLFRLLAKLVPANIIVKFIS